MKTNKSYGKRLRLTKTGKIVARKPGHNHFNAKQSGSKRQSKQRAVSLNMSLQNRARFLSKTN